MLLTVFLRNNAQNLMCHKALQFGTERQQSLWQCNGEEVKPPAQLSAADMQRNG